MPDNTTSVLTFIVSGLNTASHFAILKSLEQFGEAITETQPNTWFNDRCSSIKNYLVVYLINTSRFIAVKLNNFSEIQIKFYVVDSLSGLASSSFCCTINNFCSNSIKIHIKFLKTLI